MICIKIAYEFSAAKTLKQLIPSASLVYFSISAFVQYEINFLIRHRSLCTLYTKKLRHICISVDLQLKLFDSLVSPVFLYASEIWGFESKDSLEKIHLQFWKKTVLKLRNSTPNYMVYKELGRFPLETIVKHKLVLFRIIGE